MTAEGLRALTAADDGLHTPTSDDIFWTETAWFAFAVPERRLTGFVYPVFRTNQGVCSAGVYLWDDTSPASHELVHQRNFWHLPLPEDLTRMRLPSGLSYDVIEPLSRYRVRYESSDVSFDLEYTGMVPPRLTARGDHLDQPCHVTGELVLRGETIAVDCFEMRDKSWHVRSDHPLHLPPDIAKGAYSYAIGEGFALLAKSAGSSQDEGTVQSGWLWVDGTIRDLARGRRVVDRAPDGTVRNVRLSFTDTEGRCVEALGTPINAFAFQSTPSILAWIRSVEWEVDGHLLQGEDQEWDAASS